jgi:hypothetical protein
LRGVSHSVLRSVGTWVCAPIESALASMGSLTGRFAVRFFIGLLALFPLIAAAQALSPCQTDNGTMVVVPGATCLTRVGLAITFTDYPAPMVNTVADESVPILEPPVTFVQIPAPTSYLLVDIPEVFPGRIAQGSVAAPELDLAPLGGALTLLGGGLLVVRGRRSASSN